MNIYIDYEEIFENSKKTLRELELPIAEDKDINFCLKDKQDTCGLCQQTDDDSYVISIKTAFVKGKNIDLPILQGLMYHELLHTCPGCLNHEKRFCDYAKYVYEKTGINPNKFEPIDSFRHPDLPIKVESVCENCGRTVIYRTDKDLKTSKIEWFIGARLQCQYCEEMHWVKGYGVKKR